MDKTLLKNVIMQINEFLPETNSNLNECSYSFKCMGFHLVQIMKCGVKVASISVSGYKHEDIISKQGFWVRYIKRNITVALQARCKSHLSSNTQHTLNTSSTSSNPDTNNNTFKPNIKTIPTINIMHFGTCNDDIPTDFGYDGEKRLVMNKSTIYEWNNKWIKISTPDIFSFYDYYNCDLWTISHNESIKSLYDINTELIDSNTRILFVQTNNGIIIKNIISNQHNQHNHYNTNNNELNDGPDDGTNDGSNDGPNDGPNDGSNDGPNDGPNDGSNDGSNDRLDDGLNDE
jgi:hypothetical protein